jgi:hypothetical protein
VAVRQQAGHPGSSFYVPEVHYTCHGTMAIKSAHHDGPEALISPPFISRELNSKICILTRQAHSLTIPVILFLCAKLSCVPENFRSLLAVPALYWLCISIQFCLLLGISNNLNIIIISLYGLFIARNNTNAPSYHTVEDSGLTKHKEY